MATGSAVPVAILRDGRPSKSAVADFDALTLPNSGKPDFGGRPPQDEVHVVRISNSLQPDIRSLDDGAPSHRLLAHEAGHGVRVAADGCGRDAIEPLAHA